MTSTGPAASETPPRAEEQAECPAQRPRNLLVPIGGRIVAHGAVSTSLLIGLVGMLGRGWVPSGDAAAISLRAFASLSLKGPLVGQMTNIPHVYGLGPLEYWLLALPVHLDPATGVLWGSILWSFVACVIAIECVWSVAGVGGGLLVSAFVVGYLAWWPELTVYPLWNPYFGEFWLLVAFGACFAVLCGRSGLWPVVVVAASIAMQCHFVFIFPAVVVVVVSLIAAIVNRVREKGGYRFALVGILAGLACFSGPITQQLTATHGNLWLLLHQNAGIKHLGIHFGLQVLSGATLPRPLWSIFLDYPTGDIYNKIMGGIPRSAFGGAAVLAVLLASAAAGLVLRSRRLFALAIVSGISASCLVLTFAQLPRGPASKTITYLVSGVYIAGVLSGVTVAAALVVAGRRLVKATSHDKSPARATPSLLGYALPALAVISLAILIPVADRTTSHLVWPNPRWTTVAEVRGASADVERCLPPGPVSIHVVGLRGIRTYQVSLGIAILLDGTGYQPQVPGFLDASALGPGYHAATVPAVAVVRAAGTKVWVVCTGSPS